MSRRPKRRRGGHSAGSSFDHRDAGAVSLSSHGTRDGAALAISDGTSARSSQLNRDELDRVLEEVIAAGGADGSYVSSSSSTNNKGLYKGLTLKKGNKARDLQYQDKFIQLQNDTLAFDRLQTDNEVVDAVLNAANRSDCRPGARYGPKDVGRSSKRLCSKQQLRDELVAAQRKNDEIFQKVKMLMETQAKIVEDMTQIKALIAMRLQNTSTNVGQPSSLQHPPSRTDDV